MRPSRTLVTAMLCGSLAATLLTGCRAEVRVEIDVDVDGGATTGVRVHLDDEALAWFSAAGIDPEAALVRAAVDPWRIERSMEDGLELWLSREVDDASDIGDVLRGLADGLTSEDPAVVIDVDLQRPDRHLTRLVGVGEFRPPGAAAVLADGQDVGPGADGLAVLASRFVTAHLVVRLPGEVVTHVGDRAEGDQVVFDLTVGDPREILVEARTDAVRWPWVVVSGAVALVATAAVAVGVVTWRRSRASRRGGRREPDRP